MLLVVYLGPDYADELKRVDLLVSRRWVHNVVGVDSGVVYDRTEETFAMNFE